MDTFIIKVGHVTNSLDMMQGLTVLEEVKNQLKALSDVLKPFETQIVGFIEIRGEKKNLTLGTCIGGGTP